MLFDKNSITTPQLRLLVLMALVLLMGATRLGHFGEYASPPDASWAVFFLGGLWLRKLRIFALFFGLAFATDLAAVALGTPADCFSPAYAFLIPAYGALWVAGATTESLLRAPVAVAAGAAATFCIANLGMFLFANTSGATAATYVTAVIGYFPHYLFTMAAYVTVGLMAQLVLQRRAVVPVEHR
ncbi:MAG: hypothetical protein RL469_1361 [Pseudomonadota bacterium]|jgi:hypothetical protein|nr:hypothetical protein [Gammaproteobacteria bacterium]